MGSCSNANEHGKETPLLDLPVLDQGYGNSHYEREMKIMGENEISISRHHCLPDISSGSFPREVGEYLLKERAGGGEGQRVSVVWKAEHRSSGCQVVLKQVFLSKLNRNLRNCLDCELNFLASVEHPNIIRLLDVIEVSLSARIPFSGFCFVFFFRFPICFAQNRSKIGILSFLEHTQFVFLALGRLLVRFEVPVGILNSGTSYVCGNFIWCS